MAAVLDAFAPYVKKLIADMAQDEVLMLLGVSGEINKLEDNMESLKAFLADAERRRLTDQSVQRWVRKLKGAMYDATDILDLCHLEADKRKESSRGHMPDCFQPLIFCLRNPVFTHKIGSRIKDLNQRLEDIHKAARDFSFNVNLASYPDEQRMLPAAAGLSSYQARSQIDESAIVGEQIERDTKELVQVLTTTPDDDNDNHNYIKVVSIVGTGGMGKTTLAQKIFNEATIPAHFKTKIWLSITKNFDDAELLRTAIKHARGDDHGHGHGDHQDKSTLTDTLIRTLTSPGAGSRFLLVMDDVWSERAWDNVLSVPIRNASQKLPAGSWVLVTTRSAHLPQQMQASLHEHRVRPLHQDDAWSLLKKQLQPEQVVGIDQLKNIGMEILKNCDGLPLAVKVVGGLLSTRYPSEHEWKAVLNKPAWSPDGLPTDIDSRLYLSYEDPTPQLRQCFLYCSLFPKGQEICESIVSAMWVSEGFIQSPAAESSHKYGLEEIANEYYRELIKRNLIEPTEKYSITASVCTMHDVVRSFAEYMAREESLVVVDKEQLSAATGGRGGGMLVRRLSIAQIVSVEEWPILQRQESLRTLIINSGVNCKPSDPFGHLSSLRVLRIFSAANSDRLLSSLSKLHHLPISTVKLMHLRSIVIIRSNISTVPRGIGGLTNLRTFVGFPVHVNMDTTGNAWCSLQELAPLSQLRELALYGLEKVSASWMAEKAMISTKGYLSYLELHYNSTVEHTAEPCGEAKQQQQQSVTEEVLEKLRPPTCLETLVLQGGYVGRQLPNWMSAPASAADFKSLRYLWMENLPCCTQLPDGLCCLPILELLTIEDAPSWEEWEWNEFEEQGGIKATIAMPCLDNLYIDNCKMSRLPPGLASIKRLALRSLKIYELTNLTSLENFPSVVELDVFDCPELKGISGLSKLQKIRIVRCPNLLVLEGVDALDSMVLSNGRMEALPEYLAVVNLRYLELQCSKKLYESLSPGSSEWKKINHIRKRNIACIEE
ncbi:hypothetical protein BS78_K201200 [Paspalum vaginatum]|uniref:Uncharacterized protein n=1 Tax=Paspalum vaginatum TaxID=158149 RepID=A0A9W8CET9_9POAL|nr:hypothetical protein BS78_K201200 [Paspalum vaginatum]